MVKGVKKYVGMALVAVSLATMPVQTSALTNKEVVYEFLNDNFLQEADFSLRFIQSKNLTPKKLRRRMRDLVIYVEKVYSISHGEYGIDEKGRVIDYAKKTKVGKQVKSFLIYNPTTKDSNVIAYVDHKMIR